ncbi:hypothetical protein GLYMA_13G043950v4 [Glycine max]|nr:hypothetical protein GLYMA_13G043950v4 [Glycine max]KAH1099802.1 hypothetical protein GYH30_035116 [Glycine max]
MILRTCSTTFRFWLVFSFCLPFLFVLKRSESIPNYLSCCKKTIKYFF